MHDLLAGYPVVIEIPVAWGEMDAFQHVNNIVYFRYFESGRIAYFERAGWTTRERTGGIGPIQSGDKLEVRIQGLAPLVNTVK